MNDRNNNKKQKNNELRKALTDALGADIPCRLEAVAESANKNLSEYVGVALAEYVDSADSDIVDLAREIGTL